MSKELKTAKINLLQAIGRYNVANKENTDESEKTDAFDAMLSAIDTLILVAMKENIY